MSAETATQSPVASSAKRTCSLQSHAAVLPVPQIRHAHDLYLDPSDIPEAWTTVVAPPYPGMAAGDAVNFHFVEPGGAVSLVLKAAVRESDVGKPVTWELETNEIWQAFMLQVDTWYTVAHVGATTSDSAVQTLMIDTVPTQRLPAPSVAGHDGNGIDPGLYPGGVYVVFPLYPGAASGDTVLVYWQSREDDGSTVKWRELTAADISAGELEVLIEPDWLTANIGSEVEISYQYAREGAAESSMESTLEILVPVALGPPIVEDAEAEGDGSQNMGFLMAAKASSGVYIKVPPSDTVAEAIAIEVHWVGHPHGGQHVAEAPHSADEPLRFRIPPSAVAANIGGEGKRFEVFFRVTMPGGRKHTSAPFNLWIKPLLTSAYHPVQCIQAQGKPGLSMADVPAAGADLRVKSWPFNAAGQALSIWVVGVTTGGTATEHMVRDAVPVTQQELDDAAVGGKLPKEFLQTLMANSSFMQRAKVTYDGGETAVSFASSAVTWLA